MDKEKLREDYKSYKEHYLSLQEEAYDFVQALVDKYKRPIHIDNVAQRPNNKIKILESIIKNINESKYKKNTTIFDIKDIAGVRVTCHCEDDVENFTTLLQGELKQKYFNVQRKDIGGRGSELPYRAVHITFSKPIKQKEISVNIYCEIQLRTVMADAWAVQNHKYLYKKIAEGEAQELTSAVSEIMTGCEKLWSLVKKKSLKEEKDYAKEISKIHGKAKEELLVAQQTEKQIKLLDAWFKSHQERAFQGLHRLKITTYMEVMVRSPQLSLDIPKNSLRESARTSTIKTFGWPIGVFLDNREEYAPKVDLNGIYAEIAANERDWFGHKETSYDYWTINSNASFFLLKSLFEDARKPGYIFFNTRIVRITEVLMYLNRLYSSLGIPDNSNIDITIKHGGLKGRKLGSSSPDRALFRDYKTETDEVPTPIETSLNEIQSDMVNLVEKFTKPLFEQFEFFELDKKVLTGIVTNFLNGKVV